MAKKVQKLIRIGNAIYLIGSNTKIGKITDPFGQELFGVKFSIGSKGIPRVEATPGCEVMEIVFQNPNGSRRN